MAKNRLYFITHFTLSLLWNISNFIPLHLLKVEPSWFTQSWVTGMPSGIEKYLKFIWWHKPYSSLVLTSIKKNIVPSQMCLEAFCSRRKQKCDHQLELWGHEKKIHPGSLEASVWDLYKNRFWSGQSHSDLPRQAVFFRLCFQCNNLNTLSITFDLWQGERRHS